MKTEHDFRVLDQEYARAEAHRDPPCWNCGHRQSDHYGYASICKLDLCNCQEFTDHGPTMVSIPLTELKAMREKIERLERHVENLNHDLEATIAECNRHHGEGEG